jgi:hypothetical protein
MPCTSLRGWLERIVLSAERIVAGGGRVAGSVGLATGLDPDKGVDERVSGGACGAYTEAGALDVAPVTPLLAETLDTVAGCVDDGLAGHAGGLELGGDHGDVELLVLRLVVLRVSGFGELAGGKIVCVPACNVGGETADLLGAAGVLVNGGELLGSGLYLRSLVMDQ